ncbi:hypothetical protein [Methylomonas sp. LL1]|uniref:hypothetical protein n=1 Tax=Methylomonas sp. LL1 TaxID=2785785 RepID=UPI0018C42D8F|nr:hypothetical protein [Methylomonas sp. LL1]
MCFLVFRLFFAHLSIDPEATDVLKRWISAEYTRYHVDRQDITLAEKAERLTQSQTIDFLSVEARGKPDRMVFRVVIAPNPAQPPNSPMIRYFRLEHSLLLGWNASLPRRADPVVYFLALFML